MLHLAEIAACLEIPQQIPLPAALAALREP